jgi:hypothetical protein
MTTTDVPGVCRAPNIGRIAPLIPNRTLILYHGFPDVCPRSIGTTASADISMVNEVPRDAYLVGVPEVQICEHQSHQSLCVGDYLHAIRP